MKAVETDVRGGEEKITAKQLAEIIRNNDVRSQLAGKDYLMLIKEEGNHRCVLFASDCEEAIWTRPLDIAFFVSLRDELHLTSSLKILAEYFVKSLQAVQLERVKTHLRLSVKLQIGQGIQMASSTSLESRVHFNSPDEFKLALRKFIVYMWEVKSAQLRGQVEKEEAERQAKEEREKLERENDKSRSLFVPDKKAKRISLKHRDLVNPERKKRKKNGARLGSGYDELRVVEVPEEFEL